MFVITSKIQGQSYVIRHDEKRKKFKLQALYHCILLHIHNYRF